MAKLVAPGDALCKPLLPEFYEPVLISVGNGLLVLRGFEREGEAATVQEWRCDVVAPSAGYALRTYSLRPRQRAGSPDAP